MKEIAKKISEVIATVKQPMKSARNQHLKYDYSTKDDIFEVVREAMAKKNLAIAPSMELVERIEGAKTKSGAIQFMSRIRLTVIIIDGDSGESLTTTWEGESITSDDKGLPQAATQAMRFWAINTFMLMDGANEELSQGDTVARKESVIVQEAPPADVLAAIETRVRRLRFTDDQLEEYLSYIARKEKADSIDDVPEHKLLAWHNRMEKRDDRDMTELINNLIGGKEA